MNFNKLDKLLETITTGIMGATSGDYGNKAPDPNEDFYNRGDSRYHTNVKKKKKRKIMKEHEEEIISESRFELQNLIPMNKGKVFYEKTMKLTNNEFKDKFNFKVLVNGLINEIKTYIEIKENDNFPFKYDFSSFIRKHDNIFGTGSGVIYVGGILQDGVFRLLSAKNNRLVK